MQRGPFSAGDSVVRTSGGRSPDLEANAPSGGEGVMVERCRSRPPPSSLPASAVAFGLGHHGGGRSPLGLDRQE